MPILRLKEYREKLNMSQRDIAVVLNISQQGYWAWEKGVSFPNGERILQLCKLLECTPNDLFGVHSTYEVAKYKLDKD